MWMRARNARRRARRLGRCHKRSSPARPTPAAMQLEALEPRVLMTAPVFAANLSNHILPKFADGDALTLGIDGFDANGDALTITAVSDDPNVSIYIPTTNPYALLTFVGADGVTPVGQILVELFQDRSPTAVQRFITLATNKVNADGSLDPNGTPFYTNVKVHRAIPGFMFQTGDAQNGNGTGGSPLGDFPDVFDPDLAFSSAGVLAMANSGANTNDSQWFITTAPQHHLDDKHMIFGQMISGQSTYNQLINQATTGGNGAVVNPMLLKSVTILQSSPQDATLTLKANSADWDGLANITVTLNDGKGGKATQVITVASQEKIGAAPTITPNNTTDLYLPSDQIADFQLADDSGVPLSVTFLGASSLQVDPQTGAISNNVAAGFNRTTNLLQVKPPKGWDMLYDLQVQAIESGFAEATQMVKRFKVVSQSKGAPPVVGRAQVSSSSDALGSFQVGDLLYVAKGTAGLQIFDVSNPSSPVLKGSYNTAGVAREVQVVGNIAYVTDGTRGLISLNVANPASIAVLDITPISNPGTASGLIIDGNRAYVTSLSEGLIVYDLSNPSMLTEVGRFKTFAGGSLTKAFGIAKHGNLLYVSDVDHGVLILNVADPANPVLVDRFAANLDPKGLTIDGNTLYVTDTTGLLAYSLANPQSPVLIKQLALSHPATQVRVQNGIAIVGCDGAYIFVDVKNPAKMAAKYTFRLSNYTSANGFGGIGLGGVPSISGTRIALPVSNSGVLLMEGARLFGTSAGAGLKYTFTDQNGVEVTVSINKDYPISVQTDPTTGAVTRLTIGSANRPIPASERATVTITSKGGDASIGDIVVYGSLSSLTGKTTDLLGDLTVNGQIGSLTLDDVADNHVIKITGASTSAKDTVAFIFDELTNVEIDSAMHVRSLTATSWRDTDGDADFLKAPSLASLTIKGSKTVAGDFQAGLNLSGTGLTARQTTLGKATIAGVVGGADAWDIAGNVGSITIGSANALFRLDVEGLVASLTTSTGDLQGVDVSAQAFGKIAVKGNLGADLTATGKDARGNAIGSLTAGMLGNVTISAAQGAVGALKVVQWDEGVLIADSLLSLTTVGSKNDPAQVGHLGANLTLLGLLVPAKKPALGAVSVKGDILGGTWKVNGAGTTVAANRIAAGWNASIVGDLKSLTTRDDLSGNLAVRNLGSAKVGGDLDQAHLFIGADFGVDGQPGGTGPDSDNFGAGALGTLTVTGSVMNSLIALGVVPDPGSDLLADPDAPASIFSSPTTPTSASAFKSLSIKGNLDASSRFIAGAFPKRVKVGTASFDPAQPNQPFADNFRVNPT